MGGADHIGIGADYCGIDMWVIESIPRTSYCWMVGSDLRKNLLLRRCVWFFFSTPEGLEDVSKYPVILEALLDSGWTEAELRKIVGLNMLRVMQDVEAVSSMSDFFNIFWLWSIYIAVSVIKMNSINRWSRVVECQSGSRIVFLKTISSLGNFSNGNTEPFLAFYYWSFTIFSGKSARNTCFQFHKFLFFFNSLLFIRCRRVPG
jgi:hypothetical protein